MGSLLEGWTTPLEWEPKVVHLGRENTQAHTHTHTQRAQVLCSGPDPTETSFPCRSCPEGTGEITVKRFQRRNGFGLRNIFLGAGAQSCVILFGGRAHSHTHINTRTHTQRAQLECFKQWTRSHKNKVSRADVGRNQGHHTKNTSSVNTACVCL